MTKVKNIIFAQPKTIPTLGLLKNVFGINYNAISQEFDSRHFEVELNGFVQILTGGTYPLQEFINDYYEMELGTFRLKFSQRLKRSITERGFVQSVNGSTQKMPIRDLAFFANQQRKYGRELQLGRQRGNWIKTIYYNAHITTAHTDIIMRFINTVIQNEKLRSKDIIMLKFLKQIGQQSYVIYKIFKSIDVRQKQELFFRINAYADGFFGRNADYSENIDRLELDIIEAFEGGCNKTERKSNTLQHRIIHPKASDNNCFFKCIQPYVPSLRQRVSKSACNAIRKQFEVGSNDKIDVSTALKIFEHYRENTAGLQIWSHNTIVGEIRGNPMLCLLLEDEHYSILQRKQYIHCKECGRNYLSKHECNTNRKVYRAVKQGNHRYVINVFKRDNTNFDNSSNVVIAHYDIETHTRKTINSIAIHTPYIVGCIDNVSNEFRYFAGEDCMEQFIRHLFTYRWATKVYINAFNGSKFDHYKFINKMNKLNKGEADDTYKLNQVVLNNGSVLKATVGNIECFDISKHITGSLRQNLQELNCSIRKGEFDYDLGNDWDEMPKKHQDDCLQYLRRDVLGLKELTEKLNKECFEQFGVNLYKYLSTSQLTYSIWINRLYTQAKSPIYLQNPEQEIFFRQSIYGGRTYKYKHSFMSRQRDNYMKGLIKFEDINDYLIDADVNSLYPCAMMNEFPVGIPIKLKSKTLEFLNETIQEEKKCPRLGIYRIKYITNKYLIDATLPRKEAGQLKWDLKDGEGIYNSIDIDNALQHGYEIEILEGYYWEKTEMVFDEYIRYLYDFKKQASKGTAQYTLAKLMMNGLYGKTIQKPILDENVIIRNKEEFMKLHIKYGGVEMTEQTDGSFYVTYQDETKLKSKITKPCYLGSFILGYSRRIMVNYLEKTNPYFDSKELDKQLEHSPYYTDTDSIQIHQRNLKNLTLNNEIGGLSDDLGNNCKILYGAWIAPKLYFLEYVEQKNDKEQIKYHFRGKGIPKEQLSLELFERMLKGNAMEVKVDRDFKRIHVNRTLKQQQCENFSIVKLDTLTKTINKTLWKGRHFIENASVPLYHKITE